MRQYPSDFSPGACIFSASSLANNFELKNYSRLGIKIPDRLLLHGDPSSLYNQTDFCLILSSGSDVKMAVAMYAQRKKGNSKFH